MDPIVRPAARFRRHESNNQRLPFFRRVCVASHAPDLDAAAAAGALPWHPHPRAIDRDAYDHECAAADRDDHDR